MTEGASPDTRPSRAVVLAQVAALGIAAALAVWEARRANWDLGLAGLLLVFSVASDLTAIQTPSKLKISGSFLALVLAIAFLGGPPAAAIGVVTIAVGRLRWHDAPHYFLNNLVTYAWFPLLAGIGFRLVRESGAIGQTESGFYLLVFGAFVVSLAMNFTMIASYSCYIERTAFREKARTALLPVIPSEMFAALMAVGVAYLYVQAGLPGISLFGVVLVSFQYLLGALLQSQQRAEQLELRGRQLALMAVSAGVYERKRRIAETLQRSLLPDRLPVLPGMAIAARYVPGQSETDVGGDWYDVVSLSAGEIGLVIGDVVGRGLPAASRMGHLRDAVRAYAIEGHPPAVVCEHANHFALNQRRPGGGHDAGLATMLYGVVDPAAATLRLVSAGHPPPLLVEAHGDARFLGLETGVPLGVAPHARYREAATLLEPSSMLIFYTDGLIEEPGVSLDEGMERLRGLASAWRGQDPEELCDHLLTELRVEQARDDVALLAIVPQPITTDRLELHVPAWPESLAQVRHSLAQWLRALDASEQLIYEATVACGEACSNAVEHAYPPGRGSVDIEVVRGNGDFAITVRDRGNWRRSRGGAAGRGLQLIEALMDEVEIVREPVGTTVRMSRSLSGQSSE